jgi:dihydrofolate reductase
LLPEAHVFIATSRDGCIATPDGDIEMLRAGLVKRLTVTRVPVLLGAGLPLFLDTGRHALRHVETRVWSNGFVQSVYDLA